MRHLPLFAGLVIFGLMSAAPAKAAPSAALLQSLADAETPAAKTTGVNFKEPTAADIEAGANNETQTQVLSGATAAAGVNAADSGLAAFVAPWARGTAVITAKLGTVNLASGAHVTVDLAGDNLISIAAGAKLDQTLAGHKAAHVALSAPVAKGIVDTAVNMNGVTSASSFSAANGRIVLGGAPVATVAAATQKITVTAEAYRVTMAGALIASH